MKRTERAKVRGAEPRQDPGRTKDDEAAGGYGETPLDDTHTRAFPGAGLGLYDNERRQNKRATRDENSIEDEGRKLPAIPQGGYQRHQQKHGRNTSHSHSNRPAVLVTKPLLPTTTRQQAP